jgi:hypothetical protein
MGACGFSCPLIAMLTYSHCDRLHSPARACLG